MRLIFATLFLCLALHAASCSNQPAQSNAVPDDMLQKFAQIDETNPKSDVERNILNGESRYIGCLSEPGPPMFCIELSDLETKAILDSKNYWIFPGTTDAPESIRHSKYIERAYDYAAEYNAVLHEKQKDEIQSIAE